MKWKRKWLSIGFLLSIAFTLSGCKQIFITSKDPFQQIELSKNQLETDMFYVKDGTKFIKVWDADTINLGGGPSGGQTIIPLHEDYRAIPTLYKNEILAIASTNTWVKPPTLTRYQEIGYNIGLYGLTLDKDGYLCGTLNKNVYEKSSLYNYLEAHIPAKEYRIVTINDMPVSSDMITASWSGAFNCMEKGKEYTLEFYAGTYYTSTKAIADIFMLEAFEVHNLSEASNTKNGYLSFEMPETAKSGWYYLNGYGLFRYIAQPKGVDLATIDMNIPYFTTEREKLSMYAQRFSMSVDVRRKNLSMVLQYEASDVLTEDITGIAYAPDNTKYTLEVIPEEQKIICNLKEAMPGKWDIYIQPKDLSIIKTEIVSNEPTQEITEETRSLVLDKDQTNFYISIDYEGDGEIYAILVGENNEMYQFTTDKKKKIMTYLAPYLKGGKYTITIYHYTDTTPLEMITQENSQTNIDIITVTD